MDKLTEKERHMVEWVRTNLASQSQWKFEDYEDFYNRDVALFLSIVDKYLGKED
jgi:hypothetical protein